ncbi:hypothetical protein [Micromonospora sp. D75]|uniref:hypothetical protein n=1 Tax=Micromonospora TaxID=1873 RepID=UPI001B36C047|nr:hypothetical protein [Micromonospora sp. D75]MBQ1067091.1 hypothetical protein [Micromonospora sp. D75]
MRGEIPTFDAAIFADTGREPTTVYAHVRRQERLAAAGIPVGRYRRATSAPPR